MRYFFSCEGAQSFHDRSGTELADDHCALIQGILNASEVMADHAESFSKTPHWSMTVSDETGRVIFRLNLAIDR